MTEKQKFIGFLKDYGVHHAVFSEGGGNDEGCFECGITVGCTHFYFNEDGTYTHLKCDNSSIFEERFKRS